MNDNAPAGLFRFEIGVQSTNDLTNELVQRRQNFEKLSRTVTMVKEGGKIDQHLDLIAGLPEEDYDSFRNTFNEVFAMRPEELQLGFLKLLRGTGLRIQAEQYGYTFIDEAPYEIFSNNVLSFDDIIRIKQTEDVLEKYWNDNRLPRTVEYLVSEVFETPFDFFQQFGTYWETKGWSRIGHQLEDLFIRLNDFLAEHGQADMAITSSLMKIDYLAHHKFQPRKVWWQDDMPAEELVAIEQLLSRSKHSWEKLFIIWLNARNIRKQTFITPIAVNPEDVEIGIVEKASGYLVTVFKHGEQPKFLFFNQAVTVSNN